MLNMIAGSVLPITAFIGVFFAFAATCILTSFLNDWLPRDMEENLHIMESYPQETKRCRDHFLFLYFVFAALLFGEMFCGDVLFILFLVFVEMLTGFMDDAADEHGENTKKEFLTFW